MENHMDLNEVRIYTRNPTPKNRYTIIVAMMESIASWHRVLEHKGVILMVNAPSRKMTAEELETVRKSWRMIYYRYDSWQCLLEDEWKITQDKKWIGELITFAKLAIDPASICVPESLNKT